MGCRLDAGSREKADMVLCISEEGMVRNAIQATLTQRGHQVHVASPSHDDLFDLALGHKAARPVARWIRGKEPIALTLYDRLAYQPGG
jgi:hypothetical protein